ncbi:putative myosin type-2 heavy chain 2 [Podospora australis]|uniref:Myosin type-2 heavy chain 2 n=1 Tax=Podospora australis TaxID=1536484 RepID=A0AAN6WYS6_9PEZI|nr:putative myosin type-2 heavy chain 2 [Podospora australis]
MSVRNNPFARNNSSSTGSNGPGRPKSTLFSPSPSPFSSSVSSPPPHHGHVRTQSQNSLATPLAQPIPIRSNGHARLLSREGTPGSGTFAPSFIKTEDMRKPTDVVKGIEGENDFSGKKYVWLKDPQTAFVKGWVVEELAGNRLLVQCDDGSQREVDAESVDKVNPAKFDKANDMAELTHLNEASVVHNLHMRYMSDLIYTYSGLFLVTVNPYTPLAIYTNEYINMYKGRNREDNKPHIYAMADEAFRNLVDDNENQSILVTGESGAGKTENTKKVIQYLAAVARSDIPAKSREQQHSTLSAQILRANPILEAFGNAQTVRNNNSSRFGKFIRIEFNRNGSIAGAFIDWYLLEKSRVVRINSQERNYHIFYQLLKGADRRMKQEFLLEGLDVEDFAYTRDGQDTITGVSDRDEWNALLEAFGVMGFSESEQAAILRTIAAVLHLGNITVVKESRSADQARLAPDAKDVAAKVCKLLGVPLQPFLQGLLHPKVKAGREWVEKVQTPEQVRFSIDALAKGIYERGFGDLVARINRQLDRPGMGLDDTRFIGVLDIAGFEIFEHNSFEQLCINYTNEKLQQFFNHHMFVLEQEEYAREKIEWKFIDFGKDLQPTIDLIELPNPIGIFSCLDEDCVMPKATDKTFSEKLNSLWDKKSQKYRPSRLGQGFILTHYAAEVEYSTEGWLEKNKDPMNDNVTRLLAASTDQHVASLFSDCADQDDEAGGMRSRVKKGLFRTVAQRHKEQLSSLMAQLHSTHPHFVRCILPNHKKRAKQFNGLLVLDQLRCNGVLEGIRIARTGFPNRLAFAEFRQRYEVLCRDLPKGYLEGQAAARMMLDKFGLDRSLYRVGLTKVFFRAGVLAELEEKRDALISEITSRFQSVARGYMQRRIAFKRLYRAEATRVIQRNFHVYLDLCENPWWQLLVRMKPLLGATRTATEVKKRDEMIRQLHDQMKAELDNRHKLEEERRNVHAEMVRVQQTLESERALALDKEEIFKRLQLREAELEDKLAGALDDQERLEDQLDSLLDAKKRAEEDVERFRAQLEQAAGLIARLEQEKSELAGRVADLERAISDITEKQAERSEQETALEDEIKMLQSQLSLKERKVRDMESKLLKADQDLEVKLMTAQKELQASRTKNSQLSAENREIQQQLTQLSKTSTDYEDLVRKKESELLLLRSDNKKFEMERRSLEEQKKNLSAEREQSTQRLWEVQAQLSAMKTQQSQLQREAEDAKKLLEARLSEDAQADQNRQVLESQIKDFKEQLYQTQMELSRERQSRDDVALLAEHKYQALKDEFDHLNESKITIEKELYAQQDTLRRAMETRTTAEQERDAARQEIRALRIAKTQAEEARREAEIIGERAAAKVAREREESLHKDLEAANERLAWFEAEVAKLNYQIEDLNKVIIESGEFGLKNDQAKERLERELVTVKGRLAASENDNRALLNKLQQKGLEIARSTSRASEASRGQILGLQREKAKLEEQNAKLNKQLGESQVTVASLEKRLEKLQLNLEDLNHEVAREVQSSRAAEKATSTFTAQLAEANRTIESERQLRTQAQGTVRTLQSTLDARDVELGDLRSQLLAALKIVDPEAMPPIQTEEGTDKFISKNFDLARKIEELQQNLRVQTAGRANAEAQLAELRASRGAESPTRTRLNHEVSPNETGFPGSPTRNRSKPNGRHYSNDSTPPRRFATVDTDHLQDSVRSDRTADILSFNNRMDLKAEVEELQNQLQLAQMQNRHLQSQLERSAPDPEAIPDESGRMQKLEQMNSKLHDMLDKSSKQVSVLEKALHAGELSLRDIQTRSHEEILDLLHVQEDSRRRLLHDHNDAIAELTHLKEHFEKLRYDRAKIELDLRDAKSDLQEMSVAREQEAASRSQLLQEFADLQIRLDAETSKLADVTANLSLYKGRADEYFSKLEQAEIAVLKASRAEQFAKAQAKDAEDSCAEMMSERKRLDATIEDLQHQNQRLEEKIEDMSTDLEAATQAKKRLHHELEDYRNQRANDIEDKESSMEQLRKKYQAEFGTLTKELDLAREEKLFKQAEISRLREELDELRSKWDDEVLNSSTWSKEKARLESTLSDVMASRDEAVNAHNEAQGKIVTLLSQVRSLRSSVDELTSDRDSLAREKQSIEARLKEAKAGLEELANSESPSLRNAANIDKEILELKAGLAQQEDIAAAAVEKMRRAEALVSEVQKDIVAEREASAEVHKQKNALEKSLNEIQIKLIDLETKGYSSASHDIKFLHKRIQELENQLEEQENERSKSQRSVRNVDRTVKDLQTQIDRKDKQNAQLQDDLNRMRDKMDKLFKTIEELQASESSNELQARRAERELREERERLMQMERELESWKAMKQSGPSVAGSVYGGSVRGKTWRSDGAIGVDEVRIPQRKSSLSRVPSLTKGFI